MLKSFIEQTINGLQTGSIYALIALGYTMVYGIVKLIKLMLRLSLCQMGCH